MSMNIGDRVKIAHKPEYDRAYAASARPARAALNGRIGELTACSGQCREVTVESAKAWYDPDELATVEEAQVADLEEATVRLAREVVTVRAERDAAMLLVASTERDLSHARDVAARVYRAAGAVVSTIEGPELNGPAWAHVHEARERLRAALDPAEIEAAEREATRRDGLEGEIANERNARIEAERRENEARTDREMMREQYAAHIASIRTAFEAMLNRLCVRDLDADDWSAINDRIIDVRKAIGSAPRGEGAPVSQGADASLEARAKGAREAYHASLDERLLPPYAQLPKDVKDCWRRTVRAVDASRPGLSEREAQSIAEEASRCADTEDDTVATIRKALLRRLGERPGQRALTNDETRPALTEEEARVQSACEIGVRAWLLYFDATEKQHKSGRVEDVQPALDAKREAMKTDRIVVDAIYHLARVRHAASRGDIPTEARPTLVCKGCGTTDGDRHERGCPNRCDKMVPADDAPTEARPASTPGDTTADPLDGLPAEERDRILALAMVAEAETGLRLTAPWAGQARRDTIAREAAAYRARQSARSKHGLKERLAESPAVQAMMNAPDLAALRARRDELNAKFRSYDGGDRPMSPPAALIRELRDIEAQIAAAQSAKGRPFEGITLDWYKAAVVDNPEVRQRIRDMVEADEKKP